MNWLRRLVLHGWPGRNAAPVDKLEWASRTSLVLAALATPTILITWAGSGSTPWLNIALAALAAGNSLWLKFVIIPMVQRQQTSRKSLEDTEIAEDAPRQGSRQPGDGYSGARR